VKTPFIFACLLSCALGVAAQSSSAPAAKPQPKASKPAATKPHKASLHKTSAAKNKGAAAKAAQRYAEHPGAMALADEIAQSQGLERAWVRKVIGQSAYLPQVAKLIAPPPGGQRKNWEAYRSRFIEPVRVQAGCRFWQAHDKTLARASQTFGVPPEMVVGIIGVETLYGRHMGNFKVVDALATLSLDFPNSHPRAAERTAYFRGELAQVLALKKTGINPLDLRGSYAGAMGMPQFMPTSWAKFAVDFDGDGRIDLFNSTPDVIGSVANYFKAFNWQSGMPTHYPLNFDTTKLDMGTLMLPDILPTFSPARMAELGVVLDEAGQQHPGKLALIELQNGDQATSYVAGTDNFYAVTRYNWSSYYAMAVIELGQTIKAQVQSGCGA
jgi:membrane-bound lytic murein transglycosylase B